MYNTGFLINTTEKLSVWKKKKSEDEINYAPKVNIKVCWRWVNWKTNSDRVEVDNQSAADSEKWCYLL